jgi:hypothetical protein
MQRLVAGGMLPERAGQPVKVWAHVSLADLRAMDDESALEDEWITAVRAKADVISPRRPARSTTSPTWPTAAPPACARAGCTAFSTTMSSSTSGAGPSR